MLRLLKAWLLAWRDWRDPQDDAPLGYIANRRAPYTEKGVGRWLH